MAVTRQVIMELGAKQAASLKTAWTSMGSSLVRIRANAKGLANTFLSIKGIIIGAVVRGAFRQLRSAIESVTEASGRATEIQSKFRAVFKHLTADSEAWAESFAKSVGRSQTQMMSFMSTLQDTFVPLGYSREAAAGYSKELTKLAIDLASFNDVADADVIRDLQSALVGSVIVMRKYGVIIDESRMKQVALSEGIIETRREMTAQEKVQARMILMLQGTADAQGDAIRTAGEWTNALKGLRGAWFEVRKHIGGFITESPAITQHLAESKQALFDIVDAMKKYGPALREAVNETLESATEWMRELQTETRAWVETGGLLKAWHRIRVAMKTVVALGVTMYQGLKTIAAATKAIVIARLAMVPFSGVGLEDIRKAHEDIHAQVIAGGKAVEAAWKDVVRAASDVTAAEKDWAAFINKLDERVKTIRDAHIETERSIKRQVSAAKELSAEQSKQVQSMARQFGLMSSLEKAQVRYLAEQLKGAKGFEFFQRMTEAQREMVGRSKILGAITEKKGFGERAAEQYLGAGFLKETAAMAKVDVQAQIKSEIEVKMMLDAQSVAKKFLDSVYPRIQQAVLTATNALSQKWEQTQQGNRAAIQAGIGPSP